MAGTEPKEQADTGFIPAAMLAEGRRPAPSAGASGGAFDGEEEELLEWAMSNKRRRSWWVRSSGALRALSPRRLLPGWLYRRLGGVDLETYYEEGETLHLVESDDEEAAASHAVEAVRKGRRPAGYWVPEERAGWLSKLLFWWVGGLMDLGSEKALEAGDLWDVRRGDQAGRVSEEFQQALELQGGHVVRTVWGVHGRRFMLIGLLKLAHDIIMLSIPYLLERLLRCLESNCATGITTGWAMAMAAASLLETLSINIYFHALYRMSLHLKISLVDMVYSKSLRLAGSVRTRLGVGSIVNLQSNDAAKLWGLPSYMHVLWSGPFQIMVVMAMLVRIINPVPALAGLGVTVVLVPLSTLVGRKLAALRRELVKKTDARVKLCSEVVTGIKAIKLYAWERPYTERIAALRAEELRFIRKSALVNVASSMAWMGGPVMISLVSLVTYSLMGYQLTAAVAFPALALFNQLRFPVAVFPDQLMRLIQAHVALKRIQGFMKEEEMTQPPLQPAARDGAPAVSVSNGTFRWGEGQAGQGADILRGIDLTVPAGSLVIVVGDVGSGKSSLLSCLMGEMATVEGSVQVKGRVSYTAQDPWIQNATLRDNVLMGSTFDAEKYDEVVEACALVPDLELLPSGDASEIGEKGINLSGGQRHRVALARACYAGADVYLLDDPLSAVDAHVGRHLFDRCVCGLLRGSTRMLVTHQTQYISAADIVVVMREGSMAHVGSYEELVRQGVDFHAYERGSGTGAEGNGVGDTGAGAGPSLAAGGGGGAGPSLAAGGGGGAGPSLAAGRGGGAGPSLAAGGGEGAGPSLAAGGGEGGGASGAAGGLPQQQQAGEEEAGGRAAVRQAGETSSASLASGGQQQQQQGGGEHGSGAATAPASTATSPEGGDSVAARASAAGDGVGPGPTGGGIDQQQRQQQKWQWQADSRATDLAAGGAAAAAAAAAPAAASTSFHDQERPDSPPATVAVAVDTAPASSSGTDDDDYMSPFISATPPLDNALVMATGGAWRPKAAPLGPPASSRAGARAAAAAAAAADSGDAVGGSGKQDRGALRRKFSKFSMANSVKLGDRWKIVKVEERAKGRVDRRLYLSYLRSWGPYFVLPAALVGTAGAERGARVLQDFWLTVWSSATVKGDPDFSNTPYMFGYFGFAMGALLFQFLRNLTLVVGSVSASRKMHNMLLGKVMRLPMSFFDSQPSGRLLNRFTKDLEAVDVKLPGTFNSALNCAVNVLGSLVVVVLVSPGMVAVLAVLFLVYGRLQAKYIAASRELKRLDSIANSPIFSSFGETVQGLTTIRALRKQQAFIDASHVLLDTNSRAWWPCQCVNRWLSVRLELIGLAVVFGTAVLVSVVQQRSAGLAGLAITSALNLTGLMNWMVRQVSELEVDMNSVERLLEYDSYAPEAPAVVPAKRPPQCWPEHGTIQAAGLVVRYRPELDPVLNGMSFSIRGREKVGIAGRTGCGKSTLMMSLYRIVEPSSGTIRIDGVDICSIGLYDLRSRLALVPQDPVVFSGTVRSNLDPFGEASGDDRIWEALKRAGVADAITSMQGGLDASISEGGVNLSTGQRQLLCMARALLRRARVLVLDEATSNVDTGTDSLIQATIRVAFADCTVLTIAHRLHTIMDCDRIMVLHAGRLAEFGAPNELLKKSGGMFSSLVGETLRHRTSNGVKRTKSAATLAVTLEQHGGGP